MTKAEIAALGGPLIACASTDFVYFNLYLSNALKLNVECTLNLGVNSVKERRTLIQSIHKGVKLAPRNVASPRLWDSPKPLSSYRSHVARSLKALTVIVKIKTLQLMAS
jgi:hypothetical protein